jgi:hypothetical protein
VTTVLARSQKKFGSMTTGLAVSVLLNNSDIEPFNDLDTEGKDVVFKLLVTIERSSDSCRKSVLHF